MSEIERVNLSVYFVGIPVENRHMIHDSIQAYLTGLSPEEQDAKDNEYVEKLEEEIYKVVDEGFINSKNSKVEFRDILRILKEFEIHSIVCSIEGKGTADYVINTLV